MTRAAIYARVSSAAQRDRHTIENQLRVLPAFVAVQGWILADTYIDDGRSAKTGKLEARDGFTRLLRDAEAKLFDVLVVVDVDRLTRTDDAIERASIFGPFQRAGIDIVTPSGGRLDLRTLMGELYVTMQAMFAAEENRKRAARIMAGKLRAIAEGRKPAGPTPYGLVYSRETGVWAIDPDRAAVYREIFDRVIADEACHAIAEDFHDRRVPPPRGPWTAAKVWHLVTSRHAMGEWVADKRRKLTIAVPAIVDEATFEAAQAELVAHGKRGLRHTQHVYLLEGLAICASCNSPISIRSACGEVGKKNKPAYVCRSRRSRRIGESPCAEQIIQTPAADDRVWAVVVRELADPGLADELAARDAREATSRHDWTQDARGYRAHLERLAKVEASHLARFRRAAISDEALEVELAALRRERAAVARQLAVAERSARDLAGSLQASPAEWLTGLRELIEIDAPESRQRVVRALVRPRDAVFDGGRILLTMTIDRAAAVSRDVGASVSEAAYRSESQDARSTALRIRVVA